jgi:hypothetical protein
MNDNFTDDSDNYIIKTFEMNDRKIKLNFTPDGSNDSLYLCDLPEKEELLWLNLLFNLKNIIKEKELSKRMMHSELFEDYRNIKDFFIFERPQSWTKLNKIAVSIDYENNDYEITILDEIKY